jgi:S-DNA-T family DNA segregation ATPase FtsK/SpoIIIE
MSRRRRKQHSFDPVLSRGVIAVVLVITAIIITLSFFDKAGPLGFTLNKNILSFLFGSIRYTTPFIILIIAGFLVKDIEYDYRATHGIGAVLFFLAMSGLFHLGFNTNGMLLQAMEGNGGGIFGMVAWPLKTYLGNIASTVILVGLVIVSLLLMFNTLIIHLLMLNKKIFASLGSFGRTFIKIISAMFIINGQKSYNNEEDEYEDEEYEEEDEYEDDDEEDVSQRIISRRLKGHLDDEDWPDDEKKNKDQEAWTHKTIIRNLPPLNLLSSKRGKPTSGDIKANSETIKNTLKEFGIDVDMGEARIGPTVTRYTLKPSRGVKLSRIIALSNNLSMALAARSIRIEAPIPGQPLVGIEVPNQKTAIITLRELLENKEFRTRKHNMMIALGKDVAGKVWFADLPNMPHLLIAGATNSGKTVCVNSILMSLLYQNTAETLRVIMVDPKRVELTLYNGIPHLLTPVITNTHKTINALKWTIGEMERRFEIFSQDGTINIASYNKKHPNNKIPHIIFIVDELADLMATAAGEVEAGVIRLAQMARSAGIHLILATQRPDVNVVTGLIKANIPSRISFYLPSLIDSRTILDCPGAEKLLGNGDMLYTSAQLSKPVRIQGAFVSGSELKNVVDHLRGDEMPEYDELIVEKQSSPGAMNIFGEVADDRDAYFEEAKETLIQAGKASASFLQRKLKIGYARAARILDELEAAGIIGPADGAKPREILLTEEEVDDTIESEMSKNLHGIKEESFDESQDELNNEDEEEDEELEERDDENIDEDEEYEDDVEEEEEKN